MNLLRNQAQQKSAPSRTSNHAPSKSGYLHEAPNLKISMSMSTIPLGFS